MQDNRLTDRLVRHWELIRKDEVMPNFSQFNASALSDIWQRCILFIVQPAAAGAPPSLKFQVIGDNLNSIYSQSMLGMTFNPTHRAFPAAAVIKKVHHMIEAPAPLIDMGQFVNDRGKIIKYRSCLLPFGRQGIVTHVVAGLSWREF